MDRREAAWQRRGRSQKAQRDIIPGQTAGEIGASGNGRSVMAAWEPKKPCGSAHSAPILHRSPRAMPTASAQSRRSPWQMGHFSGTIHIAGEDGCLYRNSGKAAGALRGQRCAERWEKILSGIRGLGTDPGRKDQELPSRFGSLCQSRDPEFSAQNIEEYDEYVAEAWLRETTLRGAQRCSVQTPRPASEETAAETEAAEDHNAEMALCREEMP